MSFTVVLYVRMTKALLFPDYERWLFAGYCGTEYIPPKANQSLYDNWGTRIWEVQGAYP